MNSKTKCPKCQNDQSVSFTRYPRGRAWATCYILNGGCGYKWSLTL